MKQKANIIEKSTNTITESHTLHFTTTSTEISKWTLQDYVNYEVLFYKRVGHDVTRYEIHNKMEIVKIINSNKDVTIITYKLLQTIEE